MMKREWELVGALDDAASVKMVRKEKERGSTMTESERRLTMTGFVCGTTRLYRALAERVLPTCVVLEIGCSYGKCTNVLAKTVNNYRRVVGIDISNEVIDRASKSFPKLKFVRTDVLRDPLSVSRLSKELDKEFKDHDGLVIFIDIGGNRDLESVVKCIEYVNCELKPLMMVVKSEALYKCVKVMMKGVFDWKKLSEISNAALLERKSSSSETDDGDVYKRKYHPLKAPLKMNPDGISICRYHNYDTKGCRKFIDPTFKGPCPYDHEYCHACLRKGHRALECKFGGAPLL